MKKLYFLVAFIAILGISSVSAQNRVIRILQNGSVLQSYPVEMVDSIIIDNVIDAPSNLTAAIENNHVILNWNNVEGATYEVYRSADNINYTQLITNLIANQYVDNLPIAGTNYYKVKALVNDNESELSATPAIITMTDTGLASGLYLGVMGFNNSISTQPIALLNPDTKPTYDAFIEALSIKNATILCYSVDQAINALQEASLPTDISTVALVTFTDGLDQGSLMLDNRFNSDDDYLEAIKQRISSETIAGDSITAYSIGLRGSDVKSEEEIEKFHRTLKLLASSDENATEVQNMAEVNAKFLEIAEQLDHSTNIQTVTLKMPGISNGARIRFTFDNVAVADLSELYIEGTFNLRSRTLTDVEYHGMMSPVSGSTIIGTVAEDLVSIYFTFENLQSSGNTLLSMDFVDEFYKTSTSSSWQRNSEFDKAGQPDIINEQSSAVIMLVLDCSSSLGDQFPTVQANAKSFIATLCKSSSSDESGNGETVEKPLPTIYSTTPIDLSLAVSYNGVRYYLTQEEYAKANLSDAIIEGVTVITGDDSFIIAMQDEPTGFICSELALKVYGNNLPNKSQGELISARWSYIDNAIEAFGGLRFSSRFWTSYPYSGSYLYYTYAGGGTLDWGSSVLPVRLVYPVTFETPIVWRDPLDLTLAVKKDSIMEYYTQKEWDNIVNKEDYEKVGIAVLTDTIKFVIAMQDELADPMYASNAFEYYGDNLPSKLQGEVICARWSYIDNAIKAFGGIGLSPRFWTSDYVNGNRNNAYYIDNGGGKLDWSSSSAKYPVRLVHPFEEPTEE